MANRYWVGGAGAVWNATAGTKWATTSGGAGGAAVPTAADDVFFDANSTANATTSGALVCRSLNFTGYTKTFTMASGVTITIGDGTAGASNIALSIPSGTTMAYAGSNTITFASTSATQQTITSAKTLPSVTVNGSGSNYILGSNFTIASSSVFTFTTGTFDTGGYTVATNSFQSSGTGTRTLTGGTGSFTSMQLCNINATNLTASLSSSTWSFSTGSATTLALGGLSFGPTTFTLLQAGATNIDTAISGANTFSSLTLATSIFSGTESPGLVLPASTTQTVTGTLTFSIDSGVPFRLLSSSAGTRATISANTIQNVLTNNTTFTDIAVRGETRVFGDSTCTNGGNNAEIRFGGIHRGRQSLLGCGI